MKDRKQTRETENVVYRVMKTVETLDQIGKSEVERVLGEITQQVEKKTKVDPDQIAAVTPKILDDMPNELGQLGDDCLPRWQISERVGTLEIERSEKQTHPLGRVAGAWEDRIKSYRVGNGVGCCMTRDSHAPSRQRRLCPFPIPPNGFKEKRVGP